VKRRIYRRPALLMAAVTMALLVAALGASSASAVFKKLPNGHIVSYQPLRGAASKLKKYDLAFNNMDYNGGPIMPTNTDYMIVWSPKGLGVFPSEYIPGIARYFQDLAHDSGGNQNVDSVSTQYNDLTGASAHYAVTFGGVLLDTDPYPASQCPANGPVTNCLTDAQIQHELQVFTTAHNLPQDLTHEYFAFTPPHVGSCFSNTPPSFGGCSIVIDPINLAVFCAYHQNTFTAPMLFYGNMPYIAGQRGCDSGNHPNGPSDATVNALSHEHNESITDPMPNDTWTNGAGPDHGFEVGDQCNFNFGTPLGIVPGTKDTKYNQVINGHFYWTQEEWSNQGHTCLQRWSPTESSPTATFTATAAGGTTMNFDATGSTAPGGVALFSWQFNDAFGAPTQESPSPMISHTFPEPGPYSTGLTVYAADGLASGNGGIIDTGHNGFIPGFDFSPASPTTGQTVTFHGLKIISRQPVSNYLWEFGDGTTGSGRNPTHTYTAPGTYTVTVVQFSGVGSAFPGAGAGPVSQRTITVS